MLSNALEAACTACDSLADRSAPTHSPTRQRQYASTLCASIETETGNCEVTCAPTDFIHLVEGCLNWGCGFHAEPCAYNVPSHGMDLIYPNADIESGITIDISEYLTPINPSSGTTCRYVKRYHNARGDVAMTLCLENAKFADTFSLIPTALVSPIPLPAKPAEDTELLPIVISDSEIDDSIFDAIIDDGVFTAISSDEDTVVELRLPSPERESEGNVLDSVFDSSVSHARVHNEDRVGSVPEGSSSTSTDSSDSFHLPGATQTVPSPIATRNATDDLISPINPPRLHRSFRSRSRASNTSTNRSLSEYVDSDEDDLPIRTSRSANTRSRFRQRSPLRLSSSTALRPIRRQ
ncbi:hypothetical protein [Psittacid alphaherpesvirus 5]|uniref:Uncharacterized protein n=1 Tax=Psittacid alphaherpesvirus 5 TaxID=2972693 RepID=A0A5P9JQE0_9ALPH|nr:hypothetical protein QKU09_gp59 [Psittacid alphaherpesvirus 5]QFU14603.1 hypothetical protein [Psittacid alphaherpesvirus 5]